ncbi:MAG TPA: amino acid permease [Chitinophagales bacterium]|nr:amino acid permease [Chitinophagales bacterium]HMY42416.1 amino acid permease [Chitinophagales bacterium]HMZ93406.1 amino acid permease [Chitinophagales bacterium]
MKWQNFFRTKSIQHILDEVKSSPELQESQLNKNLTVRDLAALGIAAIVGAGIFSTIGSACFDGGPAVSLLFLGIAIACGFSALCYAEFASRVPVAGSAYTYAYTTFGELIAWIIGWDLILEYAIGNITVSIAWSGNFVKFMHDCGVYLPAYLTTSFLEAKKYIPELYAAAPKLFGIPFIINIPAFLINFFITTLVYMGIKESKNFANGMVVFKVAVILIIIIIGLFFVKPENWSPFAPNGFNGVIKGVSAVFFAYIGFDAISTTAEECKNPQRDLPKGMFYALVIATVLYILVSLALTGMVHYTQLNNEAFLANAFTQIGMNWMGGIIAFSALIATASVLLVFQIGQPRIWMSMSRDGLLPKKLASVHPKFKTPGFATIITGIIVGIPSLFLDVNLVTDLCSIGTLFAFALVCGGILILQHREKNEGLENQAKFKVPYINGRIMMVILWGILLLIFLINNEAKRYVDSIFSLEGGFSVWHHHIPIWIFWSIALVISGYTFVKKWSAIPILGFLSCSYLLSTLGVLNWLRFIVWMLIGLIIYLVYGYKKSKLNSNT